MFSDVQFLAKFRQVGACVEELIWGEFDFIVSIEEEQEDTLLSINDRS